MIERSTKASGVRWIGEMPSEWTATRLKYVASSWCDGPFGSGLKSEHYSESGVRVIRLQNIDTAVFRDADHAYIPEDYFREMDGHDARPGDVLIAGLGDESHPVGRACVMPQHIDVAMVKADCFRVRPDPSRASAEFLALALSAENMRAYFEPSSRGTTRSRVNLGTVINATIALPPVEAQRSIVRRLDTVCERLDAAIAAKESIFERLSAQRASLISLTVLRGLNPNVATRDSGTGFLGNVPAHWTVIRLKELGRLRSGVTKGRPLDGSPLRSVPYLRVANVQSGYIDLSDVAEIEATDAEVELYRLRQGDLLMNEGGDNDKLGRGAVWDGSIDPCIHQNHVFSFRPNGRALAEFLGYCTQGESLRHYFLTRAKQSTNLASISATNVREARVALPPLSEQRDIVDYLDARCAAIDAASAKIRRQIELLREYRQSVITAYVTGKIEAPPLPTDPQVHTEVAP